MLLLRKAQFAASNLMFKGHHPRHPDYYVLIDSVRIMAQKPGQRVWERRRWECEEEEEEVGG